MRLAQRTWFILSLVWLAAFIANGMTRVHGVTHSDIIIGIAPAIIGPLVVMAGHWVIRG